MIESAITSRGRTTLPKAVREALSLQPGDRVRYPGCSAFCATTVPP